MKELSVASGETSNGVTLSASDTLDVYYGGTAVNTTVQGGGVLYLHSGGETLDSLIRAAGEVVVYGGTDAQSIIDAGGTETLYDGGKALGLHLAGTLTISQGGWASATLVSSGGALLVSEGGTDVAATIDGSQTLFTGAYASGTVINGGGAQFIASGGLSDYARLNGSQTIMSGGSAISTIGNSGSLITILSGGQSQEARIAGEEDVEAGGSAVGDLLNSGAVLDLKSGGMATGLAIENGGALILEPGAILGSADLAPGGRIDLAGFADSAGLTADLNSSTDQLTLTAAGSSTSLQLIGYYGGEQVTLTDDGQGGTWLGLESIACFARGSMIETPEGPRPIETLAVGDLVQTPQGPRPLRWIGARAYHPAFAARNRALWPVCIKAGALADGIPGCDVWLSPTHALFWQGALYPAAALVNGGTIIQPPPEDAVAYFHLELAAPDLLLTAGLWSESFRDTGHRGQFQTQSGPPVAPPALPLPWPLCESGPALDELRATLAARATLLGAPPARQIPLGPGRNRFAAQAPGVQLLSDSRRPPGDARRLGALITAIRLDGRPLDLAGPLPGGGFHPPECHDGQKVRWTNGLAWLDLPEGAAWCELDVERLVG